MNERGEVWLILLLLLAAFWSAVGLVITKLVEVL